MTTLARTGWGLPDPEHSPAAYAGVPFKRLVAWLIDGIAIFALTFVASVLTLGIGFLVFFGLMLLIGFVYRAISLAAASATPGMWFAGVELLNDRGERFDGTAAFLHTLGYTVSVAIPILQVASIVLMLVSARRQGLTDHILGTAAVNRGLR
jgi:uncharacterized RDD family membrane protein YckC